MYITASLAPAHSQNICFTYSKTISFFISFSCFKAYMAHFKTSKPNCLDSACSQFLKKTQRVADNPYCQVSSATRKFFIIILFCTTLTSAAVSQSSSTLCRLATSLSRCCLFSMGESTLSTTAFYCKRCQLFYRNNIQKNLAKETLPVNP